MSLPVEAFQHNSHVYILLLHPRMKSTLLTRPNFRYTDAYVQVWRLQAVGVLRFVFSILLGVVPPWTRSLPDRRGIRNLTIAYTTVFHCDTLTPPKSASIPQFHGPSSPIPIDFLVHSSSIRGTTRRTHHNHVISVPTE
jgi:hypothetical protein